MTLKTVSVKWKTQSGVREEWLQNALSKDWKLLSLYISPNSRC